LVLLLLLLLLLVSLHAQQLQLLCPPQELQSNPETTSISRHSWPCGAAGVAAAAGLAAAVPACAAAAAAAIFSFFKNFFCFLFCFAKKEASSIEIPQLLLPLLLRLAAGRMGSSLLEAMHSSSSSSSSKTERCRMW
jgi:hypothetical protein